MSTLTARSAAALAAASFVLLSLSPASAFTLPGPSLAGPVASAEVQRVWWDRWGNWHRNGHRVPDPDGAGRRCWAGFNGVVHCEIPNY
jgi:hypothetical protein